MGPGGNPQPGRPVSAVTAHAHSESAAAAGSRRLVLVLALVIAFGAVEVVGGVLTGSLALLADAGHMATDAAGLGLALVAIWIARRPATPERTFGYYRVEIFAAVLNAVILLVVAAVIVFEAIQRAAAPPDVLGPPMLAIATGGLVANLAAMRMLHAGPRRQPEPARRVPGGDGRPAGLGGRDRRRPRHHGSRAGPGRLHRLVGHRRADPAARLVAAARRRRRAAGGDAQGRRPGDRPRAHPGGAGRRGRPRPARLDDHLAAYRAVRPRRDRAIGRPVAPSSTSCAPASATTSTSSTRRSSSSPPTGSGSSRAGTPSPKHDRSCQVRGPRIGA